MKKLLFLAAAVATLFASCSKDATEDLAVKSDAAFVASMSFDSEATTRHHINQYGNYEWEAGDMVGVSNGTTTVPFVTKLGGVTAAFEAVEADLTYLGTGTYYMAYPYGKKLDVTKTTTTTTVGGMSIPTTQRYRANSFATMTAPAFAVVENFENGQEVDFNAPASMFSFPIIGKGTIKKLTLASANSTYPIAGAIEAVISKNGEGETVVAYATVDPDYSITVDFGAGGYDLQYLTSPANVVFVVASGKIVNNEDFTLTAEWADGTTDVENFTITATPAEPVVLEPDTLYEMKTRTFGMDNTYIINGDDAVLDFITYAYLVQPNAPGTDGYPSLEDAAAAAEHLNITGNIWDSAVSNQWTALLLSDLNFDEFDAAAKYAELGSIVNPTAVEKLYRNALKWYINNDGGIESLSYANVEGGYADAPATISGLKVVGNGITAGAGLKNLVIENSYVKVVEPKVSGFLAATSSLNNTNVIANVKNVVLGANNHIVISLDETVAGGQFALGGVVGAYNAKFPFDVTATALPTVQIVEAGTAEILHGQVFGSYSTNKDVKIDLSDFAVESLDIPAIYSVAGGGKVIDFTTIESANAKNVIAQNKDNAVSIVVNGTSYYSGKVATSLAIGGDAYFTAEELAYILADQSQTTFTLTHDIDMQCGETQFVTVSKNAGTNGTVNSIKVGADQKQFEIKNLNAKTDKEVATLFGNDVNIKNVKLTNITITTGANSDAADEMYKGVSGLALRGIAQNVVVNGLTLNVDKEFYGSNIKNIGGVYAIATTTSVKDVTVNNVAINYDGDAKANVGIIAGRLDVAPNATETLEGIKLSTVKEDYSVSKNFGDWWTIKSAIANFSVSKTYAGRYPFGIVNVTNAAFPVNGNTKAYLKVEDFQSWSTRLAAGIVFANTLTDAADTKVLFDAAKVDDYKYAFILDGATIGNNADTVFGFVLPQAN